ncbi:MAG: DUF4197 domain-containing protein [Burkholderiaceae bacterium]
MNDIDADRRDVLAQLVAWAALASLGLAARDARALSLADLSNRDAAAGLKAALEQGANVAVQLLGKTDGFWGNDRVRIPLPEWLQRGEGALKLMGRGRDVEELKLGVNRAAEQAVPEAKHLLVNAVRTMSVQDARSILTGGDDSVTKFFAEKTRAPLTTRFLPIVTRVTGRIGLARQYNALASQGEKLGLVKPEQARIERHVTGKALDGLYFMIGEEERKIRRDPLSAGAAIARKVFGALQ